MKLTDTKALSRKIILAFLALTIILAVAALFVRNSISHKLENISKLAHNIELNQLKPQHALLLVHESEDDFQESLLNPDSKKSNAYKVKLLQAFNEIDSLLKEKPDTSGLTATQYNKVHYWYRQKLKLSDKLLTLKHNFDSLLMVDAIANLESRNSSQISTNSHLNKTNTSNNSDTTHRNIKGKKRGLLGRIKDAIANKNSGSAANIVEINHNRLNRTIDSSTQKVITRDKNAYALKLHQLQQHNTKLLTTQKELIALNIHISNELENIINDEKEINYSLQNEFNAVAFKSYHDTTLLLNNFYLVSLFLVLIFAALLIVFITKLNRSEKLLLEENKRAVSIAQQKMDLLLHMSHEIRNPLTGIQGFLYIFSKTALAPRQAEMLASIRHSSDMLLRTLNDTLDAAKMESSEFKINKDPFNPDFALKEVVESMEFSATKKKLNLEYHFEGDNNAILSGDSFRLKQIMVNLLSNAIKYTKTGGINVSAKLETINGTKQLQVDIIDTGEGISLEQQPNLFAKYYQTNSAKGKIGTGLGLYICKELIELQQGKISVKSDAGKGSTFSFYIPYAEDTSNSITNKQLINDPLLLLNGIKILAVDDNELNLLFLKMMTGKWNIKFYKTSNGKEALEMLQQEDITVILTDIQMPGMDGNELMTAIKRLKLPLNKIPVIAMSGDISDKEKLFKMGFSGIINKPFIEAELIKEIAKAITQ